MILREFVMDADEVRGVGEGAMVILYKGTWYLVDLERKTVSKLSSEEDLRIIVGGVI
jgi:hypothetical protein